MSQIYKASTGGGGGGITTITGDSGSVTGSTVSFYTNTGSAHCGSSVSFTAASGTEMDLIVTDAYNNTIIGNNAGNNSITGTYNSFYGINAGQYASTGVSNCGFGAGAFGNTNLTNNNNCGFGNNSLSTVAGDYNCAFGTNSGTNYGTAEANNIVINSPGVALESNALHIGSGTGTGNQQLNSAFICGIQGITVTGAAVLVSASDQLGIAVSSIKYKENIAPMGECSNAIFDLNPSIFNYKNDPDKQRKFGLIAEEVEKILPELVLYDAQGELQSVAYHDLPVLLLNEIQKLRDYVIRLENRVFELESA